MKALDLFAGTGWGVACKWLGIEEMGVEIMPEAVVTREANGMETIFNDVWDGLALSKSAFKDNYGLYTVLIASPPCQTFSLAGSGAGRAALDAVLAAITSEAYNDVELLKAFGEEYDPRTALVLTPLAYAVRDLPEFITFEQVPPVLPVWEACAEILRSHGYSVVTGNVNAEQYGVPQTRKRAILVARRDGRQANLPTPTHSKYYNRTPEKLDPGVKKWVSMAEALGWGMTDRPYLTVTGGGDRDTSKHMGDPSPSLLGSKASRERGAIEREAGRFIMPDTIDRQLTTPSGELKLTPTEAAALQSYPRMATGTRPNAPMRPLDHPSPTLAFGHDVASYAIVEDASVTPEGMPEAKKDGRAVALTAEQAAALQSYPHGIYIHPMTNGRRGVWPVDGPAPTIRGVNRGMPPGYKGNPGDACSPAEAHQRLTPEEAAALQSYPEEPPFIWCGTKSKVFLQIGNAVPPVLARAILDTFK